MEESQLGKTGVTMAGSSLRGGKDGTKLLEGLTREDEWRREVK